MTFELLGTLASVGTLVVIGAAAIVAVIQLRHARASNQIAGIMQVAESTPGERASLKAVGRFPAIYGQSRAGTWRGRFTNGASCSDAFQT